MTLATLPPRALRLAAAILDGEIAKAAPLTPTDFADQFDELLASVRSKMDSYATRLAAGRMSPLQFRQAMTATLRTAYAQAYRQGASSVNGRTYLTDADRNAVLHRLQGELYYLDNFARQVNYRLSHDGIPGISAWGDAYLTNRAGMYADSLRGAFFDGQTSRQDAQSVVYWQAVDDQGTCKPCADAEAASPYLVGNLPGLPGDLCLGGGRCRCGLDYVNPGDPNYQDALAELG